MCMGETLPFLQITLLGEAGSGKTSLINCFVNNGCSKEYTPTLFPELYYRLLRLHPENDPKGPTISVCVEIEDTVPLQKLNKQSYVNKKAEVIEEDSVSPSKHDFGQYDNLFFFFDMSRRSIKRRGGSKTFKLFSSCKPPATPVSYKPYSYSLLTPGRMSFMIVFDVTDADSLTTACYIHTSLNNYLTAAKVRVRPYVFFVANKYDQHDEASQENLLMAESFTQQRFIRLACVSSWSGKNVKRTFLDLIYLMLGNHVLWKDDQDVDVRNITEEPSQENEGQCIQS